MVFIGDIFFFIFLSQNITYEFTGLEKFYAVVNIVGQEPDPFPLLLIPLKFRPLKPGFEDRI